MILAIQGDEVITAWGTDRDLARGLVALAVTGLARVRGAAAGVAVEAARAIGGNDALHAARAFDVTQPARARAILVRLAARLTATCDALATRCALGVAGARGALLVVTDLAVTAVEAVVALCYRRAVMLSVARFTGRAILTRCTGETFMCDRVAGFR